MSHELAASLDALGRPRILAVGDVLLDRYHFGVAERISPEAPTPIFLHRRTEDRVGGAGAVARMATALGADVLLLSEIGVDEPGRKAIELMTAAGIDAQGVITTAARTTPLKERWFAGSTPLLRADRETKRRIDPGAAEKLATAARSLDFDALLIADYGKGVCSPFLLGELIKSAAARRAPIVVDPAAGVDWIRYVGASCIKCNQQEWAAVRGDSKPSRDGAAWWKEVCDRVVVTSGGDGLWLDDGVGRRTLHSRRRRALDVCGAGDMVLAALGVCVAGGFDWLEACEIANAAAGLKVERFGAAPVDRAEVVADLGGRSAKIVDAARLLAALAGHRLAGRKIVFTNGCFDLLHAGHVQLLREAKRQGDVLVVGLNSDASVRRLKGESRPIHGERHRADVLAELACVDYVAVFTEDAPTRLVEAVQPNVLVKGSDYRIADIAGAGAVLASGGSIHLSGVANGLSSTKAARAIGRK